MKFAIVCCVLILVLFQCKVSPKLPTDPAALHQSYCGSCHIVTDPANIPKSIWKNNVLPEMAARLGYKYNKYNPTANVTMEENLYIRLSQTYPEKPLIDSNTWQLIHDYIIDLAPDSILLDVERSIRNVDLVQFEPTTISLDENKLVGITNIQFEATTHQFQVSDAYGQLYNWPGPFDSLQQQFNSPVIFRQQKGESLFVTEIGYMNPSEKPRGTMYRIKNNHVDTLAQKLHRPVFTLIDDLNGDGQEEILICEFGNLKGKLSLLVKEGAKFEKKILLPFPGTIKLEIADLNKDGRKDIIVLASQGNEGIYILYQEEDLKFKVEHVIKMGPEYGSSWFQMIDYNGDGHLDIILANGDNADYSNFLKPYHGVRLFINNGQNEFEQKWFYPIYGATRVLCEDYDLDGDLDFAVMAFFPDFDNAQEEGFVWLENKDADQFTFRSHTLPKAKAGRWMVMENGDFDQDGDIDIMLGSFLLQLNREKYKSIIEHWRSEKADLLLLENKAID